MQHKLNTNTLVKNQEALNDDDDDDDDDDNDDDNDDDYDYEYLLKKMKKNP